MDVGPAVPIGLDPDPEVGMFGQPFEVFRTATESSLRMQREMMEQWFRPPTGATSKPNEGASKEATATNARWLEFLSGALTRQGENVAAAYRAASQVVEQLGRVAEARSPGDYMRAAGDYWRKVFEVAKTQSEAQLEELRRASRFWAERAKR